MAQIKDVFLLLFVHKKKRVLPAESHSLGQLVLCMEKRALLKKRRKIFMTKFYDKIL
ncbi:MAG: hypothetical protein POH28_13470 [Acidocella sp.]|nr:hypothetical protein [Acidocella sp.]